MAPANSSFVNLLMSLLDRHDEVSLATMFCSGNLGAYGVHLGPILGPIWSPFGSIFGIMLGPIWVSFWVPFGAQVGSIVGPMLDSFWSPFLVPFWDPLGAHFGAYFWVYLGPRQGFDPYPSEKGRHFQIHVIHEAIGKNRP